MLIFLGFIAFMVFVFMIKGFKIIKQSETMVIERLGRYDRTLNSGINIIWPFFDQPRNINWKITHEDMSGNVYGRYVSRSRIDLRETLFDFPRQNVITKDNVNVEINALLYFQIMDPVKAIYEIENLPNAIEKLTQTTLRNVIGELELDETLSSRDTINSKLSLRLDEATNKWGVKINRVELQDINPPQEIKQTMEKQMRAERERRARVLEAEGMKQAAILEAEGKREAQINEAEGAKRSQILAAEAAAESQIRIAEAQAQAKIKIAEAESENIRLISEAIEQKGKCDPAQYLIALKYIDTLKEMASGQEAKTVYLPYEATGVLGSLGGIKDLFGKKE